MSENSKAIIHLFGCMQEHECVERQTDAEKGANGVPFVPFVLLLQSKTPTDSPQFLESPSRSKTLTLLDTVKFETDYHRRLEYEISDLKCMGRRNK